MGGPTFQAARGGSVGIIFALTLPFLIGAMGLGIDYGYFLLDQARLQAAVDMAALSAVAGGPAGDTVEEIMRRNGEGAARVEVTRGRSEIGAGDEAFRFTPEPGGPALRVEGKRRSLRFFSGFFMPEAPMVEAVAVATVAPVISMAAGTTSASTNGGLIQTISKTLFGTDIDLSLLGTSGLLHARVGSNRIIDAVAERVGRTSGTIGSLVDEEISAEVAVRALSDALSAEGQSTLAATVLRALPGGASAQARLRLRDLLAIPNDIREVTIGSPSSYLTASLSVERLLSAALSSRTGGSAVDMNLQLPGLAKTTLEMQIGDAMKRTPSIAIGSPGLTLRTSQIAARLQTEAGLPLPALSGLQPRLPLELVLGGGTAKVTGATCSSDPTQRTVTIDVLPGLAKVELGDWSDPISQASIAPNLAKARLVDSPSLGVFGHAAASLRSPAATSVTFRGREIGSGTVRSVGTTNMIATLVGDMFDNLRLEVSAFGAKVPDDPAASQKALKPVLLALAGPVDRMLDQLLSAIGIRVGQMDVRVDDLVCTPRLVM